MIEGLQEEKYIFNLLKHIFWSEPTKEFLQGIGEIEIFSGESDIDEGMNLLIEAVRKNKDRLDEYSEELALEFAKLFVGPKNPPAIPYASFYLSESHSLMTDETIDIRKRYLEAGMAVQELYSIPDDHVGIELEFIYYLTQKIIEYFEQGKREEASRLFEIRSDFLSEHMASWLPFFADKVIEVTAEDFYKGAAFILRGIIEDLK